MTFGEDLNKNLDLIDLNVVCVCCVVTNQTPNLSCVAEKGNVTPAIRLLLNTTLFL